MKQDKKEKFQVGDLVLVKSGSRIATVTDIGPWYVYVKYDVNIDDESEGSSYVVPHTQIIPMLGRKPTLRQKIGMWWYDLSVDSKLSVILTAVNAVIIAVWLTIVFTR